MPAAAEISAQRSDRSSPWEIVRIAGSRVKASCQALVGRTPPDRPPLAVQERPTGWWDLLPFTTHRISLAPGRSTTAGDVVTVKVEGVGELRNPVEAEA